jgi:hypothetical protein
MFLYDIVLIIIRNLNRLNIMCNHLKVVHNIFTFYLICFNIINLHFILNNVIGIFIVLYCFSYPFKWTQGNLFYMFH